MARVRAGSIRLPIYNTNGSRFRSKSPELDSPPRTPKSRRRRTLLNQLRYAKLWRPRSLNQLLKYLISLILALLILASWIWEPHIELAFYNRRWIQREIEPVKPLAGCFDPMRISPKYNMTRAMSPKRYEVQAGIPLRLGMDCYDFAGTIRSLPRHLHHLSDPPTERTNFHTYWRADLVPFGERQEWMLKSFFATQDLMNSRLILWSNGDLRVNERVRKWLRKYPDAFHVMLVDAEGLARGTALEGSSLLRARDNRAWVDGDLIRLLVTWAYGGVWVDMDSLLTRDLSPLLEHEFVTQWDCYGKVYHALNGAVMHFFQHSPYLCEAFEIMAASPAPKSGTTDWGSLLYLKLWRRLVAASIPPFKVLPFCFTDARSCRLDNRLPDPFVKDKGTWANGLDMKEGGALDNVLGKIFSVHLHNQWSKKFPRDGWVERLLLKRYNAALGQEEFISDN